MAKLVLYNTLSKKMEEFIPENDNNVKMYICGPTVYDSPHIGHARTYISFDIMKRVLTKYFGYNVTLVMNITDIDDKIIKRAAERSMTTEELSRMYENEFFEEMNKLNVCRPEFVTRVTEYVPETLEMVERLESEGLTYVSNGSVYFDLNAYKKKFKYNLLRPETQCETEAISAEKRDKDDFVLWKASKVNEPTYQSKWGPGRPGWHIECSAMSSSIFGSKLDIHAGGIDLAFPHHENEIAQCQGSFQAEWVKYFLHTGHLNINGLKMSKSLKNFLTIKDILEISSPESMRIMFLQHSWNREMNYDQEQLKHADSIKKKIFNFLSNAESVLKKREMRSVNDLDRKFISELENCQISVHEALCNNINTGKALNEILDLISTLNPHIFDLHTDVLRMINNYIYKILDIFGLITDRVSASKGDEEMADILCKFRSSVRSSAKAKSDSKVYFEMCDKIRDEVKSLGYVIDDKPEGSLIRKI